MAQFVDVNGRLIDINFQPLPDGQEVPSSIFYVPPVRQSNDGPINTIEELVAAFKEHQYQKSKPSNIIMNLIPIRDGYEDARVAVPPRSLQTVDGYKYNTTCSFCWTVISDKKEFEKFTLNALQKAARNGCSTCDIIHKSITGIVQLVFERFDGNRVLVAQRKNLPSRLLSATKSVEVCFEEYGNQTFNVEFTTEPNRTGQVGCRIMDTSSDPAIRLIKSWLSECVSKHSSCSTPKESVLPRRVVEVGDGWARLVESKGEKAPYLTLSHCWGGETVTEAKSYNLESMKKNIPWETLTKTFQDAVMITWRLGFKYLWIDGLCILQDSQEDWEYHVANMAGIFSNSQLTLAATRAANGMKGCYSNRFQEPLILDLSGDREVYNPNLWQPRSFKGVDRDGISKTFNVMLRPTHGLHRRQRPREPLLKRAWVLQEQILSPRIVHFATSELVFECRTHVACECSGWTPRTESWQWETRWRKAHAALLVQGAGAHHTAFTAEQQRCRDFEAYKTLIETYTELDITSDLDRLPALAGIMYGRQGSYLAGIWRNTLLESLHWYPAAKSRSGRLAQRPTRYCGPTWSWVSMAAPIRFCGSDSLDVTFNAELRSTIVDASCQLAGRDPLGRVSSGYISLTGPSVTATVTEIGSMERESMITTENLLRTARETNPTAVDRRVLERRDESRDCTYVTLKHDDKDIGDCRGYMDVPLVDGRLEIDIGERVLCLMVSELLVLVLRRVRGNGGKFNMSPSTQMYRRVGMMARWGDLSAWKFYESQTPVVIF